jgi:hypothetical protein
VTPAAARTPPPAPRHTAPASARPPGGYRPWDTGAATGSSTGLSPTPDAPAEVPGRSWLRLAGAIAACLLLLVAIVVAYNLGRGRTPLGTVPDDSNERTPSAPASTPAARPITGVTASDFDPQGDPPDENPELTALAVDGAPATAWRTLTYTQNFGPAGLKTGVGLVLDLGARHDVSSVDLTFVGAPTSFSLYVTDQSPTTVRGLSPAATGTADHERTRVTLDAPASGRFLTVWLTSLPVADDGFRGEFAEVTVRG